MFILGSKDFERQLGLNKVMMVGLPQWSPLKEERERVIIVHNGEDIVAGGHLQARKGPHQELNWPAT